MNYYSFGMTYGEGTATSDQPFKYNGKELNQMHGLNWYDYEARMYNGYDNESTHPKNTRASLLKKANRAILTNRAVLLLDEISDKTISTL